MGGGKQGEINVLILGNWIKVHASVLCRTCNVNEHVGILNTEPAGKLGMADQGL